MNVEVQRTTTLSTSPRHISYDPSGVQRDVLPNGLRVWIEPRLESESVTALLVVRVGSRYETRANNGLSHFVEHMVFDGTEKWPTEEEVTDVIVHHGGNSNGWTDEETTTYFVQLAHRDLDLALDWLSQVVFHPTFPADKVDKERDIIFEMRLSQFPTVSTSHQTAKHTSRIARAAHCGILSLLPLQTSPIAAASLKNSRHRHQCLD